jgi:thiamine-phosphate pyrophosphorylase
MQQRLVSAPITPNSVSMRKPPCQLYLTIAASDAALARLAAALDASAIAAVMIAAPPGRPLDAATARPLVELAQAQGVAALIHGDANLARALRADGVHLPWSHQLAADYAEARDILGTRYMVGVDAGSSRHDAMEMAEAGADYIAFGIDAEATPALDDDGQPMAINELTGAGDLIRWWGEIFQTPCVALGIKTVDDAVDAADAGCEFLGLSLDAGQSPAATADLIRAITGTINGAV